MRMLTARRSRKQLRAMFAAARERMVFGAGIEHDAYVNAIRSDMEDAGFVRDVDTHSELFDYGGTWEPPMGGCGGGGKMCSACKDAYTSERAHL